MGLLPDGDVATVPSPPESAGHGVEAASLAPGAAMPAFARRRQTELNFTASEAMRTLSYWLLILATGLRNVVHAGMAFLMAPIVVWFLQGGGRSAEDSLLMAAFFVGLMSLGTFVLTPVLGWMGDRLSKPRLSALCMAVGAIALVLFLNQSGRIWQLTLGVLLLAVAESANHLNWAIMGDYFGRQAFATLRGWQHLPDQFMSMTTPVWMGWIFDQTGSYYWSLLPLALVYSLATCVYWILPQPHTPARLRAPVNAPAD
jgi:MFS family permease